MNAYQIEGDGLLLVVASMSVSHANEIENLICSGPDTANRDGIGHAACGLTNALNNMMPKTQA